MENEKTFDQILMEIDRQVKKMPPITQDFPLADPMRSAVMGIGPSTEDVE